MPDEIQGGEVAPVVEPAVVEPVVEEVKTESSQTKDESQAETTEAEAGEKDIPAEKTFTQKELDEILAKKTAKLARQRDQERTRAETLAQKVAEQSLQEHPGKPDIANYTDAEAYANDVATWKLKERDWQEQQVQAKKQEYSFDQKASDFLADLNEAGIDTERLGRLPLSDAAIEALVDSDSAMHEKLATHLLSNPEVVQRISALKPALQAAEIGKLEAKLSTAPKVSKAPDPITPIGKGNAVTNKSIESMTHEEYRAMRKAQGARWAR